MKRRLALFVLVVSVFTVAAQPAHEFRGVWVATVDNIDWPTKGNYNTENQKGEFIQLLERHRRNGMNAVIVQVRPATDAFYPSALEPWSEWLTGKQGLAPSPFYDPLQFMIDETHKRGMELHAWCNPYRAEFHIGKSSISPTHITRVHPEWFLAYGTTRYFDPGNPQARLFVVNVIRDIVRRYDVDAIHFDDYFYPYRIAGKEFPDDSSFARYGKGMNREDWRRSNTDSIIFQLSTAIKQEKKYCRFGISPFGVWRNASKDSTGSPTHAGVTNYDDLYADILLWLKNGWIDYVAPQLYWEFGHPVVPFDVLLDWWSKHSYGRACYIGIGIYRAGSNAAWRDKNQVPQMVRAMRDTPGIDGAIYFSSKTFERNPNGWNDSLQQHYYHYPALIPPMPWVDSVRPLPPNVTATGESSGNNREILISVADSLQSIKLFAVYALDPGKTDSLPPPPAPIPGRLIAVLPAAGGSLTFQVRVAGKTGAIAVTNINFQNVESLYTVLPPGDVHPSEN